MVTRMADTHLVSDEHGGTNAKDPVHPAVLAVSGLLKLPHGRARRTGPQKDRLLVGNLGRKALRLERCPVRAMQQEEKVICGSYVVDGGEDGGRGGEDTAVAKTHVCRRVRQGGC